MSMHGPAVSATVAQSTLGVGEADSGTTRGITFYRIVTLFARASPRHAHAYSDIINPQSNLLRSLSGLILRISVIFAHFQYSFPEREKNRTETAYNVI